MKKLILLAGMLMLFHGCRKDELTVKNDPVRALSATAAGGYIVTGTIKNLSRANSGLYNYKIDLWVAAATQPDVALKLPGDLTVAGIVEAGGTAQKFSYTLKAGSTVTTAKYQLAGQVTITGRTANPSSYQGMAISFNQTFKEVLAPEGSPYPSLFFNAADLPGIRQKVERGWLAATFNKMKVQTDGFLNIKTNPYNPGVATAGRVMNCHLNALAMTGYVLNDARYIKKGIEIMCAAANQYSAADFAGFNDHLAVGDAAHAYAVGYDWLYPYMTAAERTLIKNEIEEFGLWIFNCSSKGSSCYGDYGKTNLSCNHNSVIHGGLGLCALVLGDKPAWLDMATRHVRGYYQNSTDDDGYSYEGLGYYGYGSLGAVPFSVALLRNGGPDLVDEVPRNKLVPRWILRYTLPWGGSLATMNDSPPYIGSVGGFMHFVAKYHDRVGLWTWLRLMGPASGGGDGTYGIGRMNNYLGDGSSIPYVILFADKDLQPQSPAEAGVAPSFFFTSTGPNPGGRASFRSGWGDMDALATFTCGYDRHRGHNHRDENSFTFWALGEQFAIDPGYEPWETRSHNAILVDGIGQFRETNQYDVAGQTIAHADMGDAFYIKGDAKESYLNTANVAIAKRKLLFVKGAQPYLIIADDIQKATGIGEFKWLLHTITGNNIAIGPGANAVITGNKRGAKCYIKFLWPQSGLQVTETNLAGQTFVAREKTYAYNKFFKEVQAVTTTVNPRFVAFITAAEAAENPPQLSFTGTPDNMQVTVTAKDGTVDVVDITRENITFTRN